LIFLWIVINSKSFVHAYFESASTKILMKCVVQCEETTVQYNDESVVQLYSTVHVPGTVPAVKTCLFQLRDFRIQKQKITVY
jgi:hypothetical protein